MSLKKHDFKILLIPILFFFPIFLLGQKYTINSIEADIIFIGSNNYLKVEGFSRNESITIKPSLPISSRKVSRHVFSLLVNKSKKDIPIIILKDEVPIDTIFLSSYRPWVKHFVNTKQIGFIQSGEYPIEVLKQLKSIEFVCNIPWKQVECNGFTIDIFRGNNIIFYKEIKGKSLEDKDITKAIKKMKKGDFILIKKIWAKMPWDCGQKPHGFKLTVK